MSEHVRFAAVAGTLFVLSYASVAWVMAGTPVLAVAPEAPLHTASVPAAAVALKPAALPPGDGHPQRDRLRLAAFRASTAYAQAPCNDAAKAAMIRAVTSYAEAWADMMDCGPDGCDYRKINLTAATFSTPLDIRLRDAVGVAIDQHGLSIDDFPSPLRDNVAMLVRGRGAPAGACPQSHMPINR